MNPKLKVLRPCLWNAKVRDEERDCHGILGEGKEKEADIMVKEEVLTG